jgi:hypothetical protein
MVLGEPVAMISQAIGMSGELDRLTYRIGCGYAASDRKLVENAKARHDFRCEKPV